MKLYSITLKNELIKLTARKKYIVFMIIGALTCAIMTLLQVVLERLTTGIFRAGFFSSTRGMLGFFVQVFIPLIIFMSSGDLFVSERQDGSGRAAILRPASRFKLYLAKTSAIYIIACVFLFMAFVINTLLEVPFGKAHLGFFTTLATYVLDAIPLAILVLMSSFINQLVSGSGLTMLLNLVIYIALNLLGTFGNGLFGILPTSYALWHNLWIGSTLPFGAMISKISLLLGYAVVFLAGGYYIFERKDF